MKKRVVFISLFLCFLLISVFFFIRTNAEISTPLPDDAFTIVAIPDTQKYVDHSNPKPWIFTNQTQWIVDNKDLYNIEFVTHLGDIVQNAGTYSDEWVRANTSMMVLYDNNIPYGFLAGNHDDGNWIGDDYQAFDPDFLDGEDYWGGSRDEGQSNYQLLNINGMDFIFLNIMFEASSTVLNWADGILDSYPNHRCIISTHENVEENGNYQNPTWSNNLNSTVIAPHDNVFMVINGHRRFGETAYTWRNFSGSHVFEVMWDWQGICNGGDGWLGLITFYPHNDTIELNAFSPYLAGTIYSQWNNDYAINVDIDDSSQGNSSRTDYTGNGYTEQGFDYHLWLDYDMDEQINFISINGNSNNSVVQEQYRFFNWIKCENVSKYSIRVANDSGFTDVFLQLDNITVSNGNCTNSFLNTSVSASLYDYNYWEDETTCFFYLPYVYNCTEYGYDYYQVRYYS